METRLLYPTRDRILNAALKLFSDKGYLGATTREIAKEAGVAEVTLFRYFHSKEVLFEEMLKTYSFLPTLKGLMSDIEGMTYEDSLIVIAEKFLKTLSQRKALIRIMHSEMHRYPEKIHEMYISFIDEIIKTLASYFKKLQTAGILQDFDTELGAKAFLGMFFSFFNSQEIMMLKKYKTINTSNVIREFVKIFVHGTIKP